MNSKYNNLHPILAFLVIALIVTLSRLPFLGTGYGSVPDAWRVFIAAQHLIATGVYVPSRFPGYPLPEYFYALLLKVGLSSAFMFELPVAILSGIAVGLFFILLLPLGYIAAVGLSFALAFTPVFFIASTASIDYMYGFAFFMAATLAAFRGKVVYSGVFLGLAAASRSTYALAYIPLALALLDFRFDRETISANFRKLIIFAAISGGTALIFYAQLFYEYGISFLTFYGGTRPIFQVLRELARDVFGQIGDIGIALAVIASMLALLRKRWRIQDHRRILLFSLTTAAIYLLIFFRLPHRAAYLIPVLPALYVWLGVGISARWRLVLPAVLLASCFLVLKHESGRVWLAWEGPILSDQRNQQTFQCIATEVAIKARSLDSDSYIFAGWLMPMLEVLLPDKLSDRLAYSFDKELLINFRAHDTKRTFRFLTIDRVDQYVREVSPEQIPVSEIIDTTTRCPN